MNTERSCVNYLSDPGRLRHCEISIFSVVNSIILKHGGLS